MTTEQAQRLACELLVERASDALIAVAADGTVLLWNRGAESIFKYGRDEAVGRPFFDLVVPADDCVDFWKPHPTPWSSSGKTGAWCS